MNLSAIQKLTLLDFPGKVACIAFLPGCNLRCGFCHNPEFVLPESIASLQKSFLSPEHLYSFLEKRRGLLEGVVVSGGEPTIWKELPMLLREIKVRGFLVKLDTNGNNPEILEEILTKELVDYIALDIKTSEENYASLVGSGISVDRLKKSLKLIRESGKSYELRTTLIREHHTEEVLEAMKSWFIAKDTLFLQTFRPGHTLNPIFKKFHGFSTEETLTLAKDLSLFVDMVAIRS